MHKVQHRVSLGITDELFPVGSHICQIYCEDAERETVLVNFLRSGIQANERVCCVTEQNRESTLKEYLGNSDVHMSDSNRSGALVLLTTEETYFESGIFDPDRTLGLLVSYHSESLDHGYAAARAIGGVSSDIRHVPGGSRLLEYEMKLSSLLKDHPVTTLCQYDARSFDGATIMDLLKLHPLLIIRGAVVHNPFYTEVSDISQAPIVEKEPNRDELSVLALGQIMLMQTVMSSLPTKKSIYDFICRGLTDIPGISAAHFETANEPLLSSQEIRFPVPSDSKREDVLVLRVNDQRAFRHYHNYIQNFCHMVGVILKDCEQRRLSSRHQLELELDVEERTAELNLEIIERKVVEESLRDSEERLQFVLEGSQLGFWDWDIRSGMVRRSALWAAMFGYPYEEVCSRRNLWTDIVHPEDCEGFLSSISAHLEGSAPMHVCEYRIRRKEGAYTWILDRAKVVGRDRNGKATRMSGTHADITDRKNAEESRDKALSFSETLLAESPTGIQVFDGRSGKCEMANQSIADSLGGTVDELRAMNFRATRAWQETGLHHIAEEVLSDGIARHTEATFVSSFGTRVSLDCHFSRFEVTKPYLLLFATDITQRMLDAEKNRRLEEQMLHFQKLESLGVMAGGIAHDFNNILMAVLGNADLANIKLPADSPARENVTNIEIAARRAADLARQMLAYSGKGQFVVESLSLNSLVEEMTHMLEVSISKKAVLNFNFAPQLPNIEADATQIRQVIMNLVINASEAIGEKDGVIGISTGVMDCDRTCLSETWIDDNLQAGLYVYLEVADTGCGMGKSIIQKIFDPFFTTKFAGRGLGMAAVLGIIRGHKGAIKVFSEPGKGTTFKLLLPASKRPERQQLSRQGRNTWKGTGTLLLVDDEETLRTLGKEMLQALGFTVLTAANGREGLELYQRHKDVIRCVVLDLIMPHLDGEQTFRELNRIAPQVRVLMTSGYNEQEVAAKIIGSGLAGFLQKPYTMGEIAAKLQAILKEE